MTNSIFTSIDYDTFEQFLEKLKGVDISIKTGSGRSMLHVAIARKKPQHSEILIKRGADINAVDSDKQTPLHFAAIHGQLETAKLLLENGAELFVSDKYGNEPLWYAVFYSRGNYDLVKLLFKDKKSADHENKAGRSPMYLAKQIGDTELQNLLQ